MAHYDLSTARIYYDAEVENTAHLLIRSKDTGKLVVNMNLADFLCNARGADAMHRYSNQEFLDRESDYKVTFFLANGSWKYADIEISILNWRKRMENVALQ